VLQRRAGEQEARERAALDRATQVLTGSTPAQHTIDIRVNALQLAQQFGSFDPDGAILTPEKVVERAAAYEKYITEGHSSHG
jgi:hypothetical protein